MKKTEIRQQVKSLVMEYPEGISLTYLHNKVHRMVTRLQLRTLLGSLYSRQEISRERVTVHNRRETKYYPFNGLAPVRRKRRPAKENEGDMLSMEDFMPGKKYAPYIAE